VTSNVPQVTMAWASPITSRASRDRRVTNLLQSSDQAWLRNDRDVMPTLDAGGLRSFEPDEAGDHRAHTLGVVAEGRFTSYFARDGRESQAGSGAASPPRTGMLERSPESARIILFASNDFVSDQVLKSIVAASGTRYLGSLELLMNTLDWALEGEQLLDIRARGHFNRTLPPMEERVRLLVEYINYGLALLLLSLFALVTWLWGRRRRRHYAQRLAA
jgi:ABC-2 type transport system permease protein